jgi:cell division septal protein FtsQ
MARRKKKQKNTSQKSSVPARAVGRTVWQGLIIFWKWTRFAGPMLLLFAGTGMGMAWLWGDALRSNFYRFNAENSRKELRTLPEESKLEIMRLVGSLDGASLLSPDLPRYARIVLVASPWVADASSFRREFPDSIRASFTLRQPIAQVQCGNKYLLVDNTGALLPTKNPTRPQPGMPVIRAPLPDPPDYGNHWESRELDHALRVLGSLEESVLSDDVTVGYIFVTRNSYYDSRLRKRRRKPLLDLYTRDGVLIRWGSYNRDNNDQEMLTSEKLDLLRRVLSQAGHLQRGDIIDIRTRSATYSTGSAMRTPVE